LQDFKDFSKEQLVNQRYDKFRAIGSFEQ